MNFNDKNYLVTGGSSGIGLAVARRLVAGGARVVLAARDQSRLDATVAELGERAFGVVADVTTEVGVKTLLDGAIARCGSIHGLAHCAGAHRLLPLKVTSTEALATMLASHVGSSVLLGKAVAYSRATAPGASMVFVASAAALRGAPGATAYAAAKAGMIAAARCMAAELAPRGVRVNTVSPGVVLTPQSEAFLATLSPEGRAAVEREHPLGFGKPNDVASAIVYLLSGDARWVTGSNLIIDGGLTLA